MSLEQLISNYGYLAVVIGTFFEGETIMVLGGMSAHRGYLALPWVIACGFLGTLCGDQLYFYLGRIKGRDLVEKKPHWQPKIDRVFALLEKHQVWLILGFRFLYGLRTVTPFVIGAIGISPLRFLLLSICGALVWALIIGSLGYLFGHVVEFVIGDVKKYQEWLFLAVAAGGVMVWFFYKKNRDRHKP
jgi:membrane protein DedA with SNARE-associated domain